MSVCSDATNRECVSHLHGMRYTTLDCARNMDEFAFDIESVILRGGRPWHQAMQRERQWRQKRARRVECSGLAGYYCAT